MDEPRRFQTAVNSERRQINHFVIYPYTRNPEAFHLVLFCFVLFFLNQTIDCSIELCAEFGSVLFCFVLFFNKQTKKKTCRVTLLLVEFRDSGIPEQLGVNQLD